MDGYMSARKPTLRTAPYPPRTKLDEDKRRWSILSAPLSAGRKQPSSSTVTKHLLNTLSDSSNPITHSNICERSDNVVSAATGHQQGQDRASHGVSAKAYLEDRSRKLSLQRRDESPEGVLSNVRVYINGHLNGTTDVEMKRTIAQAGGITLLVPNGATHIVTSRQLIKPEWVTDSITAGRRLPESHYALIKSSNSRNLVDMLKSGGSS